MLQLEVDLHHSLTLTDRSTGGHIAEVIVTAIIQRPNDTVVRLGIDAPQNVKITKAPRQQDRRVVNGSRIE
jgi:sRNA-binding carbon storage regulator CsrA